MFDSLFSLVSRGGTSNKSEVIIYTRDGTLFGNHFEKRCTKKVNVT